MLTTFRIYNNFKKIYADVDVINYSEEYIIDSIGNIHELDDCTLLPSTGHLDRNKKEMYVGDIVKAYYRDDETNEEIFDLYYVTQEYYAFGIKGVSSGNFAGFFEELDVPDDEYEIVGNLYEGKMEVAK